MKGGKMCPFEPPEPGSVKYLKHNSGPLQHLTRQPYLALLYRATYKLPLEAVVQLYYSTDAGHS